MSEMNVQVNQSPAEQLVANAAKEVVIEDGNGRRIKLKKPGVLSQYRLIEVVGPETAKNEVYMGMVLPLIFVVEIDGEPSFFPTSKRQLEALIQRLDDVGVSAVMDGMKEHFSPINPETQRDQIKK